MAMTDQVLAAHAELRGGPDNENARQQTRQDGTATVLSPHQQLTGNVSGSASQAVLNDPSLVHGPTPGQAPAGPAVEQVPGQSDAHAGTYTLGRKDA